MHSIHHSRGRVFFEVVCALGMAASLALAWQQTGAPALLAAAAIAALYGLIHAFDMRRGNAAVEAPAPQRVVFAAEPVVALPPVQREAAPVSANDEPVAAAAPPPKAKAKSPRKATTRRPSKVAPATKPPAVVAEVQPAEEAEAAGPPSFEEVPYVHIEPLFEPKPFVRMPRPAFGRRAG